MKQDSGVNARLDVKLRKILELYLDGKTHKEIEAETGASTARVSKLLHGDDFEEIVKNALRSELGKLAPDVLKSLRTHLRDQKNWKANLEALKIWLRNMGFEAEKDQAANQALILQMPGEVSQIIELNKEKKSE